MNVSDSRRHDPGFGVSNGHVFISYVREDFARVSWLKQLLEAEGIRVWLDRANLWPGEDWRMRIRQAIESDARVFIACFSAQSLSRVRSYQNEELTLAIEQIRLRQPEDPWLIPVRLDECVIPDLDIGPGRKLGHLQRIDLFGDNLDEAGAHLVAGVLRILKRDANVASLPEAGRRHIVGMLARSLADGMATREQVRGFFKLCLSDVDEFWRRVTDHDRENVLALMLGDLDEDAADALSLYWEILAEDLTSYLRHQLEVGEIEPAAWCLSVLGSTPFADAEDYLLSGLLAPQNMSPEHRQGYINALVGLLQLRLVPRPGTFCRSCNVVRAGGTKTWQAALVKSLLASETESIHRIPRAADWVDWLYKTGLADDKKQPKWVIALAFVSLGPATRQSAESIQSLIKSDYTWAVVILRLARNAGCVPTILEISERALVALAVRTAALPEAKRSGPADALLRELDANLWQLNVPPGTIAAIDVTRALLGGKPTDFPATVNDTYFDRLNDIWGLVPSWPVIPRIQRQILACAVLGDVLSPAAIQFLKISSGDPAWARSIAEFIQSSSGSELVSKLLACDGLDGAFWAEIVAQTPTLRCYASVPMLRHAVHATVKDPETALSRRSAGDGHVPVAALADAMYNARLDGLSVVEILNCLDAGSGRQIPPSELDAILRQFQGLLFHQAVAEGDVDSASASEQDLYECYWKIVNGSLSVQYGQLFRKYLEERLQGEKYMRKLLSDSTPRSNRRVPRTIWRKK
jgi:TIR domain